MEKVRPCCGQPSDRGRLKNRTEQNSGQQKAESEAQKGVVRDGRPFAVHRPKRVGVG